MASQKEIDETRVQFEQNTVRLLGELQNTCFAAVTLAGTILEGRRNEAETATLSNPALEAMKLSVLLLQTAGETFKISTETGMAFLESVVSDSDG